MWTGSKARSIFCSFSSASTGVATIAIAAIAAITAFGGTVRSGVAGMAKELSGQSATQSINRAKNTSNEAQSEADKTKGMDAYNNK